MERPPLDFHHLNYSAVWILFGYAGALIFPITSQALNSTNYLGTALMAIFYFVAIVNYQSDQAHELNIILERKVEDRTQEIRQKNIELEDTLDKLEKMQEQVIVQEKMATLGQLVAGLIHDINTPLAAIRSMNDTKSKSAIKLHIEVLGLIVRILFSQPDAMNRCDIPDRIVSTKWAVNQIM